MSPGRIPSWWQKSKASCWRDSGTPIQMRRKNRSGRTSMNFWNGMSGRGTRSDSCATTRLLQIVHANIDCVVNVLIEPGDDMAQSLDTRGWFAGERQFVRFSGELHHHSGNLAIFHSTNICSPPAPDDVRKSPSPLIGERCLYRLRLPTERRRTMKAATGCLGGIAKPYVYGPASVALR